MLNIRNKFFLKYTEMYYLDTEILLTDIYFQHQFCVYFTLYFYYIMFNEI